MFRDAFWGLEGFHHLKTHIRQGVDMCKDIHDIVRERATLEADYAKALSKLGGRLNKITQTNIGSLAEAWGFAGTEMESEAELHRQLSQSLSEDVCKTIKNFMDTQAKARKPIEAAVEKSVRTLLDKRGDEQKFKKASFSYAKDHDKTADLISQGCKDGKPKDKEIAKLDKKLKQLEESLRKGDRDYYECCKKAELAREDWECHLVKACDQLQHMEEDRIAQLQDSLNRYNAYLTVVGPKLSLGCDRLKEAALSVDGSADIQRVVTQKPTGPSQPEQILPEFYAEDLRNQMEKEGRRQALQNYLLFIQQDLERERSSRDGVERLLDVYKNRPSFGDEETQSETLQKLINRINILGYFDGCVTVFPLEKVDAMIRYLEASHSKIAMSLADLDGGKLDSPSQLVSYIEKSKDKQGHNVSTLRVPLTMLKSFSLSRSVSQSSTSPPAVRPPVDGAFSNTPPQAEEEVYANYVISRCTAIYHYASTRPDELTIQPGDVLSVYEKMDDGWWHGELRGQVGVFPASYVKEL